MSTTPVAVFLMGPPGVGKSTIAGLLARAAEGHAIHSSAILRRLAEHSPDQRLSETVAYHLRTSEPVSENVFAHALRMELAGSRPQSLVFDGYPKSIAQSRAIPLLLRESGLDGCAVIGILLDAPLATLEERTGRRRICRNCGNEMQTNRKCCSRPDPGKRADDETDHLIARTEAFYQSIHPIVANFAETWPLHEVGAHGPPREMVKTIMTLVLQ